MAPKQKAKKAPQRAESEEEDAEYGGGGGGGDDGGYGGGGEEAEGEGEDMEEEYEEEEMEPGHAEKESAPIPEELPMFSQEEIYGGRFYDRDNEVSISVCDSAFTGTAGLARLVLCHAILQLDPDVELDGIKIEQTSGSKAPFQNLFDQIQFIDA